MSQTPRSRRPITVFLVVVVGLIVGIAGLGIVLFGIGVISPTVVNVPGINLHIQTATPGYIVMVIGFTLALITIVMAMHVDASRVQEVARLQARLQVLEAARDHLSIALDVARQREGAQVPASIMPKNAPGPAVPRAPVPYLAQGRPAPQYGYPSTLMGMPMEAPPAPIIPDTIPVAPPNPTPNSVVSPESEKQEAPNPLGAWVPS